MQYIFSGMLVYPKKLHSGTVSDVSNDSFFMFNPFPFIEASESLIDKQLLVVWIMCVEEHPVLHSPDLNLYNDHTS